MQSEILLSIAIPTYNGGKTIKQLLDMLLPQIDERVEIIISDNCSLDNTSDIVKEYFGKYSIKYYRNEENIGPDANFLQCMKLASGLFTYLISDDDVLIYGQLKNVLDFLDKNRTLALVYLETVGFKNTFKNIEECIEYTQRVKKLTKCFCTTDKKLFMEYAIRNWGFISSYLWRTELFRKIDNPERFFNSYWLQSYIHIECAKDKNALLGAIKGPIVGAGEYPGINSFDAAIVDGYNYKKMIDYAIKNGFSKHQLKSFWVWRLCSVGRNAILKERLSNEKLTKKSSLFRLLWVHPYAWIKLFPYFFVPKSIIRWAYKVKGREISSTKKRV